ncbi:MAG: Nif3-like dinuclear metal center hexameric protein [Candidatus Krumholzibacteria bacterium]|nr:Nif3-like dinuclear metal center hexameric protein [Candidatus Krumholzibacteria bacterium]
MTQKTAKKTITLSRKTITLSRLTGYLDTLLDIKSYSRDSSLNGLQVEGSKTVAKITLAVDACEESIRRAVRNRSDMLLVHHGLLWGDPVPVTGIMARRVGLLLKHGISLYAAHLPLDCHPATGNNARMAQLLGIETMERFGEYQGYLIGFCGRLPSPLTVKSFSAKIRKMTGESVRTFPFGKDMVRKVGIISGGAASMVKDAAEADCDTMLTGETAHSAYHTAREYGVNLVCGGHYGTETFGVKALGDMIGSEFGLDVRFIDIPTGL